MANLAITWLGHSAFRLRTPGGLELLFDPWYTGNPSFPEGRRPTKADLILLSHGHSDHITDAAAMAKSTGATVVGIFEVVTWLGTKGVQADKATSQLYVAQSYVSGWSLAFYIGAALIVCAFIAVVVKVHDEDADLEADPMLAGH